MLTLQRGMDDMGRPADRFAGSPNLIRQASAEDLDAAHQLVSSARAARSGLGSLDETPPAGNERDSFLDDSPADLPALSPVSNGQSALTGQVCRCEISVSISQWISTNVS
jgi:hypothetical protein